MIMLVESCKNLVWCVSRGYAGNDDKWLGKSEAVVGEWRAGAWKWGTVGMEKLKRVAPGN